MRLSVVEVILVYFFGAFIGWLASAGICEAAPTPIEMRTHAYAQESLHGIPHGLLVSLCDWENRSEVWDAGVVSHKGAIGACQILPGTARLHGVKDEIVNRPLLKWTSRGDAVRELQTALKAGGYYAGRIDGVFGPVTYDAVTGFQRSNGLAADGIVGVHTWAALVDSGSSARGSVEEQLRQPLRNIEIAAIILSDLIDQFKDPMIALAAYNGGPGSWPVLYMQGVRARWIGGDL